MKKLFFALIVVALAIGGLVGISGTSATAACPYTGCVKTTVSATGDFSIRASRRPVFRVKASTNGSAVPRGTLKIIVTSPKSKHQGNKRYYYSREEPARNGKAKFTLPKLKRGTYNVKVRFIKEPDSAFRNASAKYVLKVKKRKR